MLAARSTNWMAVFMALSLVHWRAISIEVIVSSVALSFSSCRQFSVNSKIDEGLRKALVSLSTFIFQNVLYSGEDFVSGFVPLLIEVLTQSALSFLFVWYCGNLNVSSD